MDNSTIYFIGFTAQLLFSIRMVIQWLQSEKAGRIKSPTIFWVFSLSGAFLLILYGILRQDIVVVSGQTLLYIIYTRNLMLKAAFPMLPGLGQFLMLLPMLVLIWPPVISNVAVSSMFSDNGIPKPLLLLGGVGQLIFILRFVCQWLCSEKRRKSVLPPMFWTLSLSGAFLLMLYAIFRRDPVIFTGQVFGMAIYIRNIIISRRNGIRPQMADGGTMASNRGSSNP
ncbi:MAG: lauroyl acyltransferase [Desulfobacteraceae bacterium]|nr:lauroyl acyltransferase [Desulfobacteraceae bacterium]